MFGLVGCLVVFKDILMALKFFGPTLCGFGNVTQVCLCLCVFRVTEKHLRATTGNRERNRPG